MLLVEDDDGIARPLAAALRNAGFEVTHVSTGADALAQARHVDAMVLDLGLPDLDGVEVCRQVRRVVAPTLPILVLTARSGEVDAVVALDAGADDYVTKPFRLAELQARLRALIRRVGVGAAPAPAPVITVGDVAVEPAARRVTAAGEQVNLSVKEFDLLVLLLERRGSVVERDEAMRLVWDDPTGASRTLDTHVSSLRRKLGPAADDLTTVRGVGFRWEA